jgi:hypothetical protein
MQIVLAQENLKRILRWFSEYKPYANEFFAVLS